MEKGKFDLGKLNMDFFDAVITGFHVAKKYSKQHLPTILTVGGLGLSLYSKYLTAKEAVKVHQAIKAEEEKREAEAKENGTEAEPLVWMEKTKIWVEYSWPSMVTELAADVMIAKAHSIDVGKLTAMTMLYQAAKSSDINLREEIVKRDGKAALHHMDHARRKERWNPDQMDPGGIWETGKGNTLFVDLYTGAEFHSSISHVNTAITELNTLLQESQGYGEAGYVELTDFLELLGENTRRRKCGKNACFRYNSPRDVIHPNQMIDWMDYVDPSTGEPRVAFIDYEQFLTPSDDFVEKRPY